MACILGSQLTAWDKALTLAGPLAHSNVRQWARVLLQGSTASPRLVPAGAHSCCRPSTQAAINDNSIGGPDKSGTYRSVDLFCSVFSVHQILRVSWFWFMELLLPFPTPFEESLGLQNPSLLAICYFDIFHSIITSLCRCWNWCMSSLCLCVDLCALALRIYEVLAKRLLVVFHLSVVYVSKIDFKEI